MPASPEHGVHRRELRPRQDVFTQGKRLTIPMRLAIRHLTSNPYDTQALSPSQIIRLSPRIGGGQSVETWSVEAFATVDPTSAPVVVRLLQCADGHQKRTHLLSIARTHTSSSILALGAVQTMPSVGIVGFDDTDLPLAFWLKQTPQTEAGPPVREWTTSAWVGHRTGPDGSADLGAVHGLMNEVRRRVDYVIGATSVTTTADEAVIRGGGRVPGPCARSYRRRSITQNPCTVPRLPLAGPSRSGYCKPRVGRSVGHQLGMGGI